MVERRLCSVQRVWTGQGRAGHHTWGPVMNPSLLSPNCQGGKSNENLSIHKAHRHPHIVGADLLAPSVGYADGGSTFGRVPSCCFDWRACSHGGGWSRGHPEGLPRQNSQGW